MKYFILLIPILIFSCSIPQEELEEEKPYLKKFIPIIEGRIGSWADVETPIIFEDKVIYFISDSQEGWITAYDKESLDILWTWNDAFETYGSGAKGFGPSAYVYDGLLCISQSNLSYGIDLETGMTLWHHRAESGYSRVEGFEDQIFKVTWEEYSYDATIRIASIYNGEWKEIVSTQQTDSLNLRYINPVAFHWAGEDYLSFVLHKWHNESNMQVRWLNLYSLTNNELIWTTDVIPTNAANGNGSPGEVIFHDGQLLLGAKALYSYNIEDGSLEWWKYYGNTFTWIANKLVAHSGKIYANNESHFLVAVDVHTGEELFNVDSGGLCSQMQFHNGNVYEACFASSKCFGFDASTGEKVYDIDSPFEERIGENESLRIKPILTIDPDTGLAYTSDGKHLLVYEFE